MTITNRKEKEMNVCFRQVPGNWKQFKGKVKAKWGGLTDDELEQIAGKRDILTGQIQEKYRITHGESEKQVKDWEKTHG